MALAGKDKQIIDLSNELAKNLKSKEFDSAWKHAGELSSLLKKDEELQLPYQVLECIKKDLSSYYAMNKELNKVTNRAFAIGCSFERSASI